MRKGLKLGAAVAVIALSGACGEPPAGPETHDAPAFGHVGSGACPGPVDFSVTDEASLLAALSAAGPGDVVGLDGFFEITADVVIATDDLTITCVTPGSGLFAREESEVAFLIEVDAKRVTIDRLRLHAGETSRGPYLAFNDGETAFAEDARFTNNRVTCGPFECAFIVGAAGTVIARNRFASAGSITGVHFQGQGPRSPEGISPRPVDGSRVERNTIVTAAPSTNAGFGGIRVKDGRRVMVAGNAVLGPWQNSMSVTDIVRSPITLNRLRGAAIYGIRLSFNADMAISVRQSVFRRNLATGAGSAGIFAQLACRNLFVHNNVEGNSGDVGAIFDVTTGANIWVGEGVVIDSGDFDCNGDGVPDPNVIMGGNLAGSHVAAGVDLGDVRRRAVASSRGIELE